jgi:polysaccharide biosynthesis/export protein
VRTFGLTIFTLRDAAFRCLALALLMLLGMSLVGCSADSFLDPSVTGRWKQTPTVVPILERLSFLEDEPAEFVATSPVMPGDLVPEVDLYRLSAGDAMVIQIQDYFQVGRMEEYERQVDLRGYVEIPRLPPVRAQGRTVGEFTTAVEQAIRDRQINDRPVVGINVKSQRKQTFAVMGAVQNPGTYFIPSPDYRLLEGLTSAGSFNETLPFIFVVRQVPLTDAAGGRLAEPEPSKKSRTGKPPSEMRSATPPAAGEEPKKGEDLLNLIDEMVKEKPQPKSPGAMGSDTPAAPTRNVNEPPAIDLPDPSRPQNPVAASGGGGWIYADGKWVKARAGSGSDSTVSQQNLVTQRVIKIPTGPLLAGAADVNIVLRPGDVIRAPIPKSGNVYISGEVSRPGVYSIPNDGRLTLTRAIAAASGLAAIAIPEKVDLTRMVGNDRQATVCVNFRAIQEGTQPDFYLKADDHINVGTNFWAYPLAVIRSGFRASYGYGFILDRNFQGDVFGVDSAITR